MQLRVFVSNKTYTLSPTRDYVVGIGEDCDLPVGGMDDHPIDYLRLSFDQEQAAWLAFEIDAKCQMSVNGQRKLHFFIRSETKISVDNQFLITAIPEEVSQAQTPFSIDSNVRRNIDPLVTRNSTTITSPGYSEQRIPIINLGLPWFKISSPSDGVGIWLRSFDLHQTYSVERNKVGMIREKLYERVYQSVSNGSLNNAKVRLLKYRKTDLLQEDVRKYLLVTRDTIHGNRTTIFMRFLEYGDNLFVGIDVFSLGRISWARFSARLLFTFVLFFLSWLIIPLFLIIILWWKIVWRMNYEKKFWLALRQEHPGKIGIGPFDDDDIIMFSKSTLHLAVRAIRDVFSEENLPIDSLDRFIQNINNTTIVNKIDNRGGNIGQNIVGANNTVR